MTYEEARQAAIEAAKSAITANYSAARSALENKYFGKELDRKSRKQALKMGGFELPKDWTISMVTPNDWGPTGYRRGDLIK